MGRPHRFRSTLAGVAAAFVCLLAAGDPRLRAQDGGVILRGVVRAVQSEASLPGARIVATSIDGRSHQARSGADGRFAIALPGPADYAVAVTTAGYAPAHLTVTTPLVVAVERALPGNRPRLVDPEWLERMAPLARQVTVNEGAVAAVELTVRPLPAE